MRGAVRAREARSMQVKNLDRIGATERTAIGRRADALRKSALP
jgi:hypothetical protein